MTPLEKYDAAVERYMEDARIGGKSSTTLTNYGNRLRFFRDFWLARHNGEPKTDPTPYDMRAWVQNLSMTRKQTTIAQYVTELRQFFTYCTDESISGEKLYEANPVYKRLSPKVSKKPYDAILTPGQIAQVYDWVPKSVRDIQCRAVLYTLLDTGIRSAELVSLREKDVDFDNMEIVVECGKGEKFRTVDMHESTALAIKAYLKSGYRPKGARKTDILFSSFCDGIKTQSGQSFTSYLVESKIREITGEKDVRAHDLRHVSARMALCSGMPLERLQGRLGHSSIVTTQIYSGALTATKQITQMQEAFDARNAAAERLKNEDLRKLFR